MLCDISQSTLFCWREVMEKKFFGILTDLAYGLQQKQLAYEKLRKNGEHVYCQQPELTKAIQELGLFMLENGIVDGKGFPIAPQNETDAINNYFSKTLDEWPCAQHPYFQDLLVYQEEEERLIYLNSNRTHYEITSWCEELAAGSRNFNYDAMQGAVYEEFAFVKDEQYVFLRKYLIDNPIIDLIGKYEFAQTGKKIGLTEEYMERFIKTAYESIPEKVVGVCGYCKWTVIETTFKKRCIDSRCLHNTDNFINVEEIVDKETKLRLKPGVMKFMSLPGRDEMELYEYCKVKNLDVILWPEKDSYDLKIEIQSIVLAVDVKSYYSPFLLANHLENKGVFKRLKGNERSILVIPDHRVQKKGYLEIIQTALLGKKVECMTMKTLKKILREEAEK